MLTYGSAMGLVWNRRKRIGCGRMLNLCAAGVDGVRNHRPAELSMASPEFARFWAD